jgi:rhamnosyltransferase subunit B
MQDTALAPNRRPRTGKHIVMTTFGSFGDVHPYIAIALELQTRGHRVTLATGEIYRSKIEALGIGFHAVRPDLPSPDNREVIRQVMDLKTGSEYLFKQMLMPHLRESYEDLSAAVRDADLLVTHVVTFAGPLVAQKTGIPWISTVLAPISFFSIHDQWVPPVAPALVKIRALAPAANRVIVQLMKKVSTSWIEPVYRLRAEVGLPRGAHPIFEGQHSPQMVLALFSRVLAEPQPDWPPHTRITGFCFYDRKGDMQLPSSTDDPILKGSAAHGVNSENGLSLELSRFVEAGPPPIVFTLGSSAVMDAGRFYEDSAEAARRLGQRAVLLIGDASNRPRGPLPDSIAAFDYAPYSALFARAAAIVHQGGAGTTGQALRSGRPMLIMPYSHDQPDHGARITRLGVGRSLPRDRYNATTAAQELRQLLSNPEYSAKAADVGRRVRAEDGPRAACDAIEEHLARSTTDKQR